MSNKLCKLFVATFVRPVPGIDRGWLMLYTWLLDIWMFAKYPRVLFQLTNKAVLPFLLLLDVEDNAPHHSEN
jgi:hypothetical protein